MTSSGTRHKEAAMSPDQMHLRNEFDRAYQRAVWNNRIARLRHRPNGLRSYSEIRRQLIVRGESYRGIQEVPVDRIVGSMDRCDDFDAAFRPLRADSAGRWVSVAHAYDAGRSLPPVQLYQIADAYFVCDGHHRVSVARVRGQGWVDAVVVEVLVRAPLPATRAPTPSPPNGIRVNGWTLLQRLAEVIATGMGRRPRVLRTP
jgi:hypothetical protein